MVGLDRFELSTSRLSGVRSNQLSYRPKKPVSDRKTYEDGEPYVRQLGKHLCVFLRSDLIRGQVLKTRSSLKGGDPAAGSPTATLLRLHPSR